MTKREAELDPKKRVLIVASDPATANQFNETIRRVRECMFALKRLSDFALTLDENDEADSARLAPKIFEMMKRVVQQYPNAHQFDADMVTLREFRSHVETLPRPLTGADITGGRDGE